MLEDDGGVAAEDVDEALLAMMGVGAFGGGKKT